ncbi:MAG: putative toxin-antitoxin system toxin component, PIN family [Candidatus Nanoarchaeia archaeon]
MLKVTLDTNILISGSFWTGDSFRILELIDKHKIISVLSNEIIEEYYETLISPEILKKVKNKALLLTTVAQKIITNSVIVSPSTKINLITEDFDDNKILECAKEGKVDYIITKDNHLLKFKKFERIQIITPDEFLRIYRLKTSLT